MSDRPNAKDRALAALTPPAGAILGRPGSAGDSAAGGGRFVTGSVFAGRYRMIAPIARGSLSEVWRADDLVLQTPVALKLLSSSTTDARARILAEVRLARQITHPAVCRVFDVGEAEGTAFYSMELVEGEDLDTLVRRAGRLPVETVVEIGAQVCDALAAAHAQGVVHGHLTPSNVLLDEEGFVRITDFGLAPPADAPPSEKTDLHAAGVILFQLLVGEPPFSGESRRPGAPARPSMLVPEIPRRLERVILQALARDPAQRPASAAVMSARLQAAASPDRPSWRRLGIAALVIVVGLLAGVASFVYRTSVPPLSNRDTMVVADFTNTTGEAVFDGALKVALAVALEQSPFLQVFPDERVRETLRLMERSPEERVTRALAREIAMREQLKALVAGSIARLGSHYVLTIEAVNAPAGDVIAREQVEVAGREEVLTALGTAVSRLRGRLGESLASIQRFDAPLARATTASLDALHAYSLALDEGRVNLRVEAIPHLQRAIELDPQFALAQALLSGVYANTGRTAEAPLFSRRAFELRSRVSERERFFISWRYYIDSAQAWDQALTLAASWTQTYPREPFAFNSLGMASAAFGRHDSAVDAFRTALRLDSRFVPPHGNLVGSLIALGRFDEAGALIRETRAQRIDATSLSRATYMLAFLADDPTAMAAALTSARATPGAALPSFNWEAHTAAAGGRIQHAHALFQRAIQDARVQDRREVAAQWAAEDAESHAILGQCGQARAEASVALELSRDNFTLERVARSLALCGADADASFIAADIARRFPDATLTRQIQLPVVDALIRLRSAPASVVDRLEPVRPYDAAPSAESWPGYVRGLAYLQLKDGPNAAREFQRILDHRGEAPASLLYPLATLGTARAATLAGDPGRARVAYEHFFHTWKDADSGLAPLDEARREYAALR